MSNQTPPLRATDGNEEQPASAVPEPVNLDTFRGGEQVFTAQQTTELVEQKKEETVEEVQQIIEQTNIKRLKDAVVAFRESLANDPNKAQWNAENGITGVEYELRHVKNMANSMFKALGAFMEVLCEVADSGEEPEPTPEPSQDDPDDPSTL